MRRYLVPIVLLGALILPSAAFAGNGKVGSSSVFNFTDTNAAGQAEALPTTASIGGAITRLSIYLDPANTASQVEIGVYSNASSQPSSLLASCTISSPTAGTWNRCTIPKLIVSSGVTYWMSVLQPSSSSGTIKFRDQGTGATVYTSSSLSLSALPATFSIGASWVSGSASIYGDNPDPNIPASAAFSFSPGSPEANEQVAFDASGSTGDAPLTYTWEDDGPDGPGGTQWPLGTGSTLNYTFTDPGTKHVRLTVTDVDGDSDSVVHDVVVSEPSDDCAATASTATAVRSAVIANPGQTVCVDGNVGDVDLTDVRPTSETTLVPDPTNGGRLGVVTYEDSHNITIDGLWLGAAVIQEGSSTIKNQDLAFRNCQVGGTATARVTYWYLVSIRAHTNRVSFDHCSLGWTDESSTTQDTGMVFRISDADVGDLTDISITDNKISHSGCDALQVAGATGLVLDHNEISYVGDTPGYDCHADWLQILSVVGRDNEITNNYVHHIGYYDESSTPGDTVPSGQGLIHGFSDAPVLFQNNLLRENRNYGLMFKEESDGSVADNWTIDHNTIIRQGPQQPTADHGPLIEGSHALTNNIFSDLGGSGVFSPNTNNVIAATSTLSFDSTWHSTDHPTAGIQGDVGPDW